jgi:geranylgeranyl diphosphate synthase type II
MQEDSADKVDKVVQIFKDCKADEWALQLKNKYSEEASGHLDDIAVLSERKEPLKELAGYLIQREN